MSTMLFWGSLDSFSVLTGYCCSCPLHRFIRPLTLMTMNGNLNFSFPVACVCSLETHRLSSCRQIMAWQAKTNENRRSVLCSQLVGHVFRTGRRFRELFFPFSLNFTTGALSLGLSVFSPLCRLSSLFPPSFVCHR